MADHTFLGRKISQQAKQTEEFALQAHRTLTAVARNQNTLWRCPECDHCKNFGIAVKDTFTSMPTPSSLLLSLPKPTRFSQDLDLTEPSETADILHSEFAQEFYGDDLNLGQMDFEPSYLDNDMLAIMPPNSCSKDFRLASVVPEVSDPSQAAIPKSGVPHVTASMRDNICQRSVESEIRIPEASHGNDDSTTSACSSSTRSPTRRKLNQTETAIHLAAREGQQSMITILLRSGAGVDCRDDKGATPLHNCAERGHVDALESLLDSGADPSAMTDEGESVIVTAVKAGQERVVEILVEALRDY